MSNDALQRLMTLNINECPESTQTDTTIAQKTVHNQTVTVC